MPDLGDAIETLVMAVVWLLVMATVLAVAFALEHFGLFRVSLGWTIGIGLALGWLACKIVRSRL